MPVTPTSLRLLGITAYGNRVAKQLRSLYSRTSDEVYTVLAILGTSRSDLLCRLRLAAPPKVVREDQGVRLLH